MGPAICHQPSASGRVIRHVHRWETRAAASVKQGLLWGRLLLVDITLPDLCLWGVGRVLVCTFCKKKIRCLNQVVCVQPTFCPRSVSEVKDQGQTHAGRTARDCLTMWWTCRYITAPRILLASSKQTTGPDQPWRVHTVQRSEHSLLKCYQWHISHCVMNNPSVCSTTVLHPVQSNSNPIQGVWAFK